MEPFRGIGNFDGKKRVGGHAHNEVPNREEPCDKNGRPLIAVEGHQAQIACRLFCRDGYWPGWFEWAVGRPVPRRFQQEAARLAMLMGTGRTLPPIFPPAATKVAVARPVGEGRWTSSLPAHVCFGGVRTLDALGPVAADNSIVCTARRAFTVTEVNGKNVFHAVDSPGCGKRFVLDKHGNRVERK